MSIPFQRTAIAAVLSVTIQPAFADSSGELPTIFVTATRVDQDLSDVLPSASVITREQIVRTQVPTLVDLVQSQPGVEIGRNGGPGTVSSIFMRGQASANVAVFIDGVPVQRDSLGGLKLVDIPPSQIEKIEILRGNMGAIYGESAVGGVINIFTRAGSAESGPTVSASYGSRNTSGLTAGYNLHADDFKLGFSVQRFETDGYSAMNPSQNPTTVNPDDDAFQRESIFVNGEKTINDQVRIGFQANHIDAEVEYDSDGFGFGIPNDTHHSEQQSSDLTLYSSLSPSPEWSSRVALTQSKFENREFQNAAANGSYDGDQISLRWNNTYAVGPGNATFGAELVNAEFETPGKYERGLRSYYGGYSGRLESFDYQVNLRRDEIEAKDDSSSNDKSANTWLVGAGYYITDAFKLTGLVSTSFRAPSTSELFDVPAWFTTGNPNLKPEEHEGYELGFSYETELGGLRVVYFDTATTNAIAYVTPAVPTDPNYENIGKTDNKGFELGFDGYTAGWSYALNAVFQDPRNTETDARLARRAKVYGSIDLGKNAWEIDWGTQILWSGNRDDFSNTLDAYTVVNLTATKNLTSELTARLRVENAFDEDYQLAYGYDAVPRGVFLSVQYQPK